MTYVQRGTHGAIGAEILCRCGFHKLD